MSKDRNGVSLKDAMLEIRYWFSYFLSKWVVILLLVIVSGTLSLLNTLNKKPTYTGTLTFVLANNSSSNNGLASIAGQFGIDVGGSGGNSAFEGDNMIELLKSHRIIKGALLKTLSGEKKNLANIIGEELGFFENWRRKEALKAQLPFPENGEKITPIQDSLLNIMHVFLLNNSIKLSKRDKKLSFYDASVTSTTEIISGYLVQNIVNEAAKMYIETKTKIARENLSMLQREADSLRTKLSGTIYASANHIDQTFNLNPALQIQRAPIQQNQLQAQVLGAAYGEVIKNLEIAKITLQKETPLFQIIDEPTFPLIRNKASKVKALAIGVAIGFFLAICSLMVSRIFRLASDKQE